MVATISRLLKNIRLFCKRSPQKRRILCKRDLYIFRKSTNCSYRILTARWRTCKAQHISVMRRRASVVIWAARSQLRFSSKEPYVLSKEPCILQKEPYILASSIWAARSQSRLSSNEPYVLSKEPCILQKEPYILASSHEPRGVSRGYHQKSPVFCERSPIF